MRIGNGLARFVGATIAVGVLAGLVVGASPLLAGARGQPGATASEQREVIKLKDARLKFEINATDGDGGVQVFIDADSWKTMSILDPGGRRIFSSTTEGRMAKQGGTELFLESAEPPFSELSIEQLLDRFPKGTYGFRGTGLDGQAYVGSARLTHNIPDGPKLISPLKADGPQSPAKTVVRWNAVAPPNGSPIIGYQVLVVRPDTGLKALPTVVLDVMMPPSARSMAIPPGFLQPNAEYEWEVLAIEKGGNQTLSSDTFTTSR
ncbi:MAG: hypothetical protein HW413_225 [Thermoleophilia bacterium]|nr:hypothetical protein [Thermoleophilia bacterium]